ncbi:MAG: RNA polymerase sigma factor [Planctomycetota bacterium]
MQDPLTELMLRVAAGDRAAFAPLVELVYPRLVGYFRRLGARPDEAEDGAQEVLVKVYRARRSYVAKARFTTYAFRIARNHWIDRLRHEGIQPNTISADLRGDAEEGSTLASRLPGTEAPPPESLAGGELGRALEEALASLPPDLLEVWTLSQVEGLRYQEIGEILEIPVGTVKSRVHAAVRRLRAWLSARGFEP